MGFHPIMGRLNFNTLAAALVSLSVTTIIFNIAGVECYLGWVTFGAFTTARMLPSWFLDNHKFFNLSFFIRVPPK